jgi:hypothetical protein
MIDDKAAMHAAYQLGVSTNMEFIKQKTKRGPLFVVMTLARKDAIQALKSLAHVDPVAVEDIRKLQNEVQRFVDLLGYVREIFERGDEAEQRINAQDADELIEAVAAEGGEIPGVDA